MLKLFQKKENKNLKVIKEITEQLLSIMGMAAKIECTEEGEDTSVVRIMSEEGGLLIGLDGANLFALQHIIRLMAGKKLGEEARRFILDINDYRKGRVEILKEMAIEKAEQVVKGKKEYSFRPMSSYERRIIHVLLGSRQDIICQSEGEGEERHIVIRPAGE